MDELEAVDPFLYYACAKAIGRAQPDARFDISGTADASAIADCWHGGLRRAML
jgi:hypothetical protein